MTEELTLPVERSAVTVLGLGSMGTALARALLERGHRLTVWNRSADRASSLLAQGAALAATPAQAVAASPLVIMCVLDYAAADAVLTTSGVASALAGRTLVQLSTGSPEQVCAQQKWVQQCQGRFIAGGIMAYPRAIGRPSCVILYAGDPCFEQHRAALASLGASSQYLGPDPVAAVGAYFTLSSYMIGALGLFFETAALARHYGVGIDRYYLLARLITDEVLDGIADGAQRVASGHFEGRLASIDLTIAGMQEVCDTFRRTGIDAKLTAALVEQLKVANACGDGDKDISRLVEVLWSQRKTVLETHGQECEH
jgi:3-hydroxyisobutyrate dehydrogenase-like beta-hydroxyacid dehydrogenase